MTTNGASRPRMEPGASTPVVDLGRPSALCLTFGRAPTPGSGDLDSPGSGGPRPSGAFRDSPAVMAKILMPLPDHDFDVTESAVPWRLLTEAGHEVIFATELGEPAAADPLLLEGVLFGQLGAEPEPVAFYRQMVEDAAYRAPLRWADLGADGLSDCDALWLTGGHAPGMKQYLGSAVLQEWIAGFAQTGKPVAAICHGVLVLARARRADGRSVLAGRRTTCLPKYMEQLAYFSTAWKLGRYYRTYPAYVEDEVREAVGEGGRFERGPTHLFSRGTRDDDGPAFVVEDGSLLSARWPGDAYLLAKTLLARLGMGAA